MSCCLVFPTFEKFWFFRKKTLRFVCEGSILKIYYHFIYIKNYWCFFPIFQKFNVFFGNINFFIKGTIFERMRVRSIAFYGKFATFWSLNTLKMRKVKSIKSKTSKYLMRSMNWQKNVKKRLRWQDDLLSKLRYGRKIESLNKLHSTDSWSLKKISLANLTQNFVSL